MLERFLPRFDDESREPRLADAFRVCESSPVRSDDMLRARIVAAARPALARLRERPRAWWEWTAIWARAVIPAGMAASIAAGALLVWGGGSTESVADAAVVSQRARGPSTAGNASTLLFDVATGVTSAAEAADELVARPSDDWLFNQVLNDNTRSSP